jgi:hypothetical protein
MVALQKPIESLYALTFSRTVESSSVEEYLLTVEIESLADITADGFLADVPGFRILTDGHGIGILTDVAGVEFVTDGPGSGLKSVPGAGLITDFPGIEVLTEVAEISVPKVRSLREIVHLLIYRNA